MPFAVVTIYTHKKDNKYYQMLFFNPTNQHLHGTTALEKNNEKRKHENKRKVNWIIVSFSMIWLPTSALIRRKESEEDRQELLHGLLVLLVNRMLLAGLLALFAPLGLLVLVAPVTVTLLAVMSPSATAVTEEGQRKERGS